MRHRAEARGLTRGSVLSASDVWQDTLGPHQTSWELLLDHGPLLARHGIHSRDAMATSRLHAKFAGILYRPMNTLVVDEDDGLPGSESGCVEFLDCFGGPASEREFLRIDALETLDVPTCEHVSHDGVRARPSGLCHGQSPCSDDGYKRLVSTNQPTPEDTPKSTEPKESHFTGKKRGWYCIGMKLVEPSAEYKDSFIEAVKEFQVDMEFPKQVGWYHDLSLPELEKDFGAFVQKLLEQSKGKGMPEGWVPQDNFWLIDNGEFIGATRVRHRLNDHLLQIGGHIGYAIRPSKRKRGYGTKILKLALGKAKEIGIEKVLLTCDNTNLPSSKIIENNRGEFENEIPNPETGIPKRRYWISL